MEFMIKIYNENHKLDKNLKKVDEKNYCTVAEYFM